MSGLEALRARADEHVARVGDAATSVGAQLDALGARRFVLVVAAQCRQRALDALAATCAMGTGTGEALVALVGDVFPAVAVAPQTGSEAQGGPPASTGRGVA